MIMIYIYNLTQLFVTLVHLIDDGTVIFIHIQSIDDVFQCNTCTKKI